MPSSTRTLAASLLVAAIGVQPVCAQQWPQRSLRMLVPQGAGSSNDTLSRIVALRLSEILGQQVVVDNRPGAGGIIGMELAARAAPDGYTLLGTATATQVIAPLIQRRLSFDPMRDLAPVSLFGVTQNVMVVHPALAAKSPRDLIALLKASPGRMNMASAGAGSQSHLAGVQFLLASGADATHVPYKGGGASVAAVVSGEAQFTITPLPATLTFIRSGQLRALATAGAQRTAQLTDVPTLDEAGLKGFRSTGWVGLMVPSGTAAPRVRRLNEAVVRALSDAATQEQISRAGADPVSSTPQAFGQLIREEWDRLRQAVTAAKLAID